MYALRTRPPVIPKDPLDLHVLGLPLAFILSQDQTLHRVSLNTLIKVSLALIYSIYVSLCLILPLFSNLPLFTFILSMNSL